LTNKRMFGLSSVLRIRPEIKSLIERGDLRDIQEFDPSPSLADVVIYYEYLGLREEGDVIPAEVRNKCSVVDDIFRRLRVFVITEELFERTYLSENMDDLIVKVFSGLLDVRDAIRRDGTVTTLRSRIIVLPSLLGGGKTHLLITLFHLVKLYNDLVVAKGDLVGFKMAVGRLDESLAERLAKMVEEANKKPIRLAAIDGTSEETAPDPHKVEAVKKTVIMYSGGVREVRTYNIQTMWGAIAHYLDNFSIVSRRDESNSIPSKEELKSLLSGNPALIMIDEPLVYASRYGDSEKLRDFFQVLAVAIKEIDKGIFIISLPVSQEDLIGGETKGVAREIYEVLARTQPSLEIVPPLKAPEIVHVLKKRLFENKEEELRSIGKEIASLIVSKGGEVLRNAIISVYSSISEFEKKIEENFPFNPEYLGLLEDFVNHLRYLQRTRDSIRLTIMALAAVFNRAYRRLAGDFYLISPYHLPVYDGSVRSYLANPNSSDYQILMSMYDGDVEDAPKRTSRPELAHMIASCIWLRTVIGRGIPEKTFLKLYPTESDILLMIYDPAVFGQQNIGAGAVREILEELYSYSSYMIVLENRYFMTQLLPIDELINRRIREISDIQAQKRLSDLVKELFEPFKKRKKRERIAKVFTEVHIVNIENKDLIPPSMEQGEDPFLVIFSYEPDDNEIGNFLTRNNIVVVVPSMKTEIEDPEFGKVLGEDLVKRLTKELVALETIDINDLKKMYGEEFAEAKKRQIGSRINEIRKKITQVLFNQLYNRIIVGKPKWTIKQFVGSVLTATEESGVKAVEELLVENSYIPAEYSYTKNEIIVLAKMLGKTRFVHEEGGLEEIRGEIGIGSLWNWMLTTVEPPFKYVIIDFNGFLKGVQELFEDLDIAIRYGDNFVWKQVRGSKPTSITDKGDWNRVEALVNRLKVDKKSLKIIPWRSVLSEFINELRSMEGLKTEKGVKKYVKIMVDYADVFGKRNSEELLTFLQRDGWDELAKTAVFWRTVEYPEYAFTFGIESITVEGQSVDISQAISMEPGEEIAIRTVIGAEEYPFNIKVDIKLDQEIKDSKTVKGGKRESIDFKLKIDVPGEHQLLLEAVGRDPKKFRTQKTLIIKVVGEIGEELILDSEGIKRLLEDPSYSKVLLRRIILDDMSRVVDLVNQLRDVGIKSADLKELMMRSLKTSNTVLKLDFGRFELYEDLRAFVGPLFRNFRFESGLLTLKLDEISDKKSIKGIVMRIEKQGIKSVKYGVGAYRRVG